MIGIQVVRACSATLLLVLVLPCLGVAEEAGPRFYGLDGRAGVRVYVPGSWGMLSVEVGNPSDRPVEILSSVYIGGQSDLQYVRPLWVPARAVLTTWQPIFVPPNIPEDKERVEVKSILMAGPNREVVRNSTGQMVHDGLLPVRHSRPVMGILADPDDLAERATAGAMCLSCNVRLPVADLSDRRLPMSVESLDAVDQLVISSDRLVADAAAAVAVRRWLHGGGRLWVLLDQVAPSTVSMLLGDAFRCHVVDRVGLTGLEVQQVSSAGVNPADPPRKLAQPVDLVRVAAKGFRVTHSVNGWPAALWLPAGRGQVLVTTLGARGWTRPRTPADVPPGDSAAAMLPVATEALSQLAREFCQRREPPPLDPERLTAIVSEQVGYEVVSRSIVMMALGTFCLALVICGLWLTRIDKLERLGWIGPILAILAACSLGLAGRSSRNVVPASVAMAQVVEVDPHVDELRVTGLMGIYQPDSRRPQLGATSGGIFALDMDGLSGTTRRMVWTDFDRWHWENITLPAGLRMAPFRYATGIGGRIRARATFGPEGLIGEIEAGPLCALEDAIIATGSSRNLAVRFTQRGHFAAGYGDMLAAGQFTTGAIVSQRQKRMQQMLYEFLQTPGVGGRFRLVPTLVACASPLDMPLGLLEDVERLGGALTTIPLDLQRPPPGGRVAIPAIFLPYRSVEFPDAPTRSNAYSNYDGKWLGPLFTPTRTLLRFQCPSQVLPLRCRQATLTVAINAPSRTVTILGIEGGRSVTLSTVESPVGTKQFTIDRPGVLRLDGEGGLLLGISVAERRDSQATSILAHGWKIEDVHLELAGETGPE